MLILRIKGPQLDASSKAFVDKSIPTLVSTWSWDEFQKRTSVEFQKVTSKQQWTLYLPKIKQLGKLESYEGCEGQSYTSLTFQNGLVVKADYTANAEFQKGSAEINVELIRRKGLWQISRLEVDSPLFLK